MTTRDNKIEFMGHEMTIVDPTATNNHKEATMETYKTYEINGQKGVDGKTAMKLIGMTYANQLMQYVDKGKIHKIGVVQAKGKVDKNVYLLEDVLEAASKYRPRNDDAPDRFEIEIHEDVLALAIKEIETDGGRGIYTRNLIDALKGARNLTEERRLYNASRKPKSK
jgi:hypothetical protein